MAIERNTPACRKDRQYARRITKEQFGRIGVLMGGPSSEREISLKSGQAVCEALRQSNLQVVDIDIKTDSIEENINLIKSYKIDCAFVALHGRFGEDGGVQSILEILKVPYTGSRVEASRLAMDKVASRQIFQTYGLKVPKYRMIDKSSPLFKANPFNNGRDKSSPDYSIYHDLGLPLVVKPATHGSSIGLSIIDKKEDLKSAIDLAFTYDEKVIAEEYISGREVTVGILDESALPVIEIIPKKMFFDYEAKYQPGLTDYVVPAKLEEQVARDIKEAALRAHKLLGCFGCSRVDMILNNANRGYVLEVNTIPGLTNASLLPKAAKCVGIEFNELCLKLIRLAYEPRPSLK